MYSNSVSSLPNIVPAVPVINSITPSDQQLSVDFTVPSYDGTAVLYYMYSLNGGEDISANEIVSPIVITGLTNTASYSVQLKAVNVQGSSSASAAVSSIPNIVPAAPALNSIVPSDQQLSVYFTQPAYNGTDVLQYLCIR